MLDHQVRVKRDRSRARVDAVVMGPLTWNAREIHRDHDNGTICSFGCLHVALPLGLNYMEGLERARVFGTMNSISNASFFALLQSTVPARIQGRVFTMMMSLIMSMTPVGLALAGPVADLLGLRIWYTVAGVVMMVISVGALFVPTIQQLEEEPHIL